MAVLPCVAHATSWWTTSQGSFGICPAPGYCATPLSAAEAEMNSSHCAQQYGSPCILEVPPFESTQGEMTQFCPTCLSYQFFALANPGNILTSYVAPAPATVSSINPVQTLQVASYISDPVFSGDQLSFTANSTILSIEIDGNPFCGASCPTETSTTFSSLSVSPSLGAFVTSTGTDQNGFSFERHLLQTRSATVGTKYTITVAGSITPSGSDVFSHYSMTVSTLPTTSNSQWTPGLIFGSTLLTSSYYTIGYADYLQVGKQMHVELHVQFNAAPPSGPFTLVGLPCASATDSGGGVVNVGWNFVGISGQPTIEVAGTSAYFFRWSGTGTPVLTNANFAYNTGFTAVMNYLCQ
jgi:hypothetical protein